MEVLAPRDLIYRCYAYGRLSREDAGKDGVEKRESDSIANQRAMIHDYIAQHPDLKLVMEGYDDGQTGTNFDRPYFQEMIGAIRKGKVNCVIVKDLSRFGREYIGAGEFLEKRFPQWGVRFIAIAEGYDTAHQSPSDSLMVPVKNLINEMYARDASQKIRSALAARRARGAYLSSFAPYGYKKDPSDKNHLLPDGAAAEVVQTIFAQAAGGRRPKEIAQALNSRSLSSPGCYRRTRQLHRAGEGTDWTASTVSKLLRNVTYLGHTAQGKTTRPSFKSKVSLPNPVEDWVVVKHTHTPLVTQACFDEAHRRLAGRVCRREGSFQNRFSGLAWCAACGHAMSSVGTRRKGALADLACGAYKLHGGSACTNHFIGYEILTGLVVAAVREALALTEGERMELIQLLGERWDREAGARQENPARLRREQDRTEELIRQLYEDRQTGALEADRFYLLLEHYQARVRDLKDHLASLEKGKTENASARSAFLSRALAELENWGRAEEVENGLLFGLLNRIEVGQGRYIEAAGGLEKRQTVELFFRFQIPEGQREILM